MHDLRTKQFMLLPARTTCLWQEIAWQCRFSASLSTLQTLIPCLQQEQGATCQEWSIMWDIFVSTLRHGGMRSRWSCTAAISLLRNQVACTPVQERFLLLAHLRTHGLLFTVNVILSDLCGSEVTWHHVTCTAPVSHEVMWPYVLSNHLTCPSSIPWPSSLPAEEH